MRLARNLNIKILSLNNSTNSCNPICQTDLKT
jgi:hypothetical protein